MDFDNQPIGSGGDRCIRHRRHQMGVTSGVRRIDNNGQMSQLFQYRHRRDIEGIAGSGLKGTDTALAEDNASIPFRKDILGAHQIFLNRRSGRRS